MTQTAGTAIVFIGTYTQTDSQGIYTCRFDADTGALEHRSTLELSAPIGFKMRG